MKNAMVIMMLIISSVSCVSVRKSSLPEDKLFQTRRYVGTFIGYRHTDPVKFGDPHLIWIKTNMESIYGKISAYSRDCKFPEGERLYVRKIYYSPGGISGYWIYQIESSDQSITYRLSEYQYDKKKSVRALY